MGPGGTRLPLHPKISVGKGKSALPGAGLKSPELLCSFIPTIPASMGRLGSSCIPNPGNSGTPWRVFQESFGFCGYSLIILKACSLCPPSSGCWNCSTELKQEGKELILQPPKGNGHNTRGIYSCDPTETPQKPQRNPTETPRETPHTNPTHTNPTHTKPPPQKPHTQKPHTQKPWESSPPPPFLGIFFPWIPFRDRGTEIFPIFQFRNRTPNGIFASRPSPLCQAHLNPTDG